MRHLGHHAVAEGDGSVIVERVQAVLSRRPYRRDRPRITLTYAQSLDGCIAADAGTSTQISNWHSQVLAHQLRTVHDAIMIGVNTVLVDDPLLTARYASGDQPRPIVVDSRLRTPLNANLTRREDDSLIIATTEEASADKAAQLTDAGATIMRLTVNEKGLVDLAALFKQLPELGIGSVIIEGGAKLITSVLQGQLADQLVLAISPRFLGGVRAVGSMCQIDPELRPSLKDAYFESMAGDLIVHGEFDWAT